MRGERRVRSRSACVDIACAHGVAAGAADAVGVGAALARPYPCLRIHAHLDGVLIIVRRGCARAGGACLGAAWARQHSSRPGRRLQGCVGCGSTLAGCCDWPAPLSTSCLAQIRRPMADHRLGSSAGLRQTLKGDCSRPIVLKMSLSIAASSCRLPCHWSSDPSHVLPRPS